MITKQELETIRSRAPLLSEGHISPFQVSNMSKREKIERERNIQIRYKTEEEYKRQNMTKEEKEKEKNFYINKDIDRIQSSINNKKRTIEYLKELPAFKSKRMNSTKRAALIEEEEINNNNNEINKLKGGLIKNE